MSNGRVTKSIYEFFLSIIEKIFVHNFDCIKSRIPDKICLIFQWKSLGFC